MDKLPAASLDQSGLSIETITHIQHVLTHHPAIERAILYGSRAKGNYKPASDIDLTLYAEKLTYAELIQIENELDDLLLPYTIDLSWYQQLDNSQLIDHINRCGVVFYCAAYK